VESQILEEVGKDKKQIEMAKLDTRTLGGWCLVDALVHCANASDGILAPLILKHGPPLAYVDHLQKQNQDSGTPTKTKPKKSVSSGKQDYPSFRSLCRTVAGQQLAGAAANTIWRRLLEAVTDAGVEDLQQSCWEDPSSPTLTGFTPDSLLAKAKTAAATETLRTTAGLSRAKCDCIVAIAKSFKDGFLTEDLLMPPNDGINDNNDEEVREKLLSIKGLGPWSVDMFLMFRCHRSNVLPIGDLAVRNGTGALWKVSGHAKDKSLCAKKDASTIATLHAPFEPYRSISSYYMYKVVGDAQKAKKKKAATTKKKKQPASKKTTKEKKN